jgi:HK97 family phage prohead protease
MSQKRIIFTGKAAARMKFVAAAATEPGAAAANSIGTLEGYALVWSTPSTDRGGYKVVLAPDSAKFQAQVHALYHHDFAGGPLGDLAGGTLRLAPDAYGVKCEIDLPNTTLGRDVAELVRTGRVGGMSFAMTGNVVGSMDDGSGEPIYTATSYEVDEVTVTAIPAFESTSIAPKQEIADEMAKKQHRAQYHRLQQLKLATMKL